MSVGVTPTQYVLRLLIGIGEVRVARPLLLSLLLHSLVVAPAVAEPPASWKQFGPEEFPHRQGYALVLDDVRRRLILFGGSDGARPQDDVWILSPGESSSWKRLVTQGPTPAARMWAIAAFDGKRDRMMVSGGNNGSRSFDDLWFLSFASEPPMWSRVEIPGTGIPANAQHAAVFVPERSEWVIVGGTGAEPVSNKVWVMSLDGEPAWRVVPRRGDSAPAPRRWHVLARDPERDGFVLHGGADEGGGTFGDAWTLEIADSATWHLIKVAPPESLFMRAHLGAWDPATRSLVVVRGYQHQSAVWRLRPFDGTPWERVPVEGDAPDQVGWDAAGVVDPATGLLLTVAGSAYALNETWGLALGETCRWSLVAPGPPAPPMVGRCQVLHDARRGRLVVLSGSTAWSVDLAGAGRWSWIPAEGDAPSPRGGAGAVYDPSGDRMIVFGGSDGADRAFDDLWIGVFDDDRIKWSRVGPLDPAPSARNGHSMVLDARRRRVVLFGGERGGCCRKHDVWTLDLDGPLRWTELEPRPGTGHYGAPGPTSYHHAVYDSVGDRMIMAGGIWQWGGHGTFELRFSDLTWQYIGGEYKTPVRYSGGMILDPVQRRLVSIEPGQSSGTLHTVSALDLLDPLSEWTPLETSGDAPADGTVSFLVYVPDLDAAWGYTGWGPRDQWLLRFAESVPQTLDVPGVIDASRLSARCSPCSGADLRLSVRTAAGHGGRLEIHDLAGRRLWGRPIATGASGELEFVVSEARDWAPGVYFARLRDGAGEETARLVILR